ncbi:hypothetical protein Aph02nite_45560 [Actinoplanes philippinensis]|uniref:Uncharacterized protein n=1 Tax=Actinoplanes philippinensis TaxID=35752 RepID=A0A1I2I544_9ACTN|nr:hypothetical protein [Actinoplanes philippinensis]GIE78606.1 hypothetical protein Aph02nite_45560 [Actinoplanes philippinensis]SFF37445.1 hypothetical protein SAMN05421541_109325 [Actinoplanes philippinensis]
MDAENPPRRLLPGRDFPEIEPIHQDRLQTWRDWQPVSVAAFGDRVN